MKDFHFLRPYFLLLLLPFFGWVFWYFRVRQSSSSWRKICSKDLLPYVLGGEIKEKRLPYYILLLIGTLLIAALAGPAWELKSQPMIKTGSGLVIALDLSLTMNAGDIKPSRLQRAIYKITDILNSRKEGQTALIVFTADPYVVTPLTDDVATIKAMLPVLETNIMPSQGHEADKAIMKASELLKQGGISHGSILLVGAELSDRELEKSIAIAAKEGVAVSVLGVATEDGAPISTQEGGFEKDDKGAMILSRLSKDQLSKLAKATRGTYMTIRSDDSDSRELAKQFSGIGISHSLEETEIMQDQWNDAGYWLVLGAIPFVSLFFRRGILNHFIWLAIFFLPSGLQAFSWEDLWYTPDKRAEALFHRQEYEQARDLFEDNDWQGAAHYRLGDFAKAAECFQCNPSVEGYYNCGTARAKQGDYERALKCYEKVLEIDPHHEDTLYNKKLIEDLMKNQEKKDQQQDSQDKNNQEQKDKENNDQQQNSQDKNDEEQKESESRKENEEQQDPQSQEEQKGNEEDQSQASEEANEDERDPQREVDDRWLQKVADDPGGLLRRKFMQEYLRKNKTIM